MAHSFNSPRHVATPCVGSRILVPTTVSSQAVVAPSTFVPSTWLGIGAPTSDVCSEFQSNHAKPSAVLAEPSDYNSPDRSRVCVTTLAPSKLPSSPEHMSEPLQNTPLPAKAGTDSIAKQSSEKVRLPRKGKGKGMPPGLPPGGKAKGKNSGSAKGNGKGSGSSPRKADVVPNIPLKKIFWNPICIDETRCADDGADPSIWERIHGKAESMTPFDAKELELLFADLPFSRAEKPKRTNGEKVSDMRRLFEEKRHRQIWCMVVLMPDWRGLPEAILKMDDKALTSQNLDLLHSNLPTAEEEDSLKASVRKHPLEENEAWDTPEEFMIMLTAIPAYAFRIQVWNFLNSFESLYSRFVDARRGIKKACTTLRSSVRIERLLAVILYVGNYLNGGTSRGCADGFDIDTLLKIGTLKTLKKEVDGSLLDFIVRQMEQERPGMLSEMYGDGMEKEQMHCARKHKMNEIRDEVALLRQQGDAYIKKWDDELSSDTLLVYRRKELEHRVTQLSDLCDDFDASTEQYVSLCAWFQMDADHLKPTDEFFGIWDGFLTDVKKSLDDGFRRQRRVEGMGRRSIDLRRSMTPDVVPGGELTPRTSASRGSTPRLGRKSQKSPVSAGNASHARRARPITPRRSGVCDSLNQTRGAHIVTRRPSEDTVSHSPDSGLELPDCSSAGIMDRFGIITPRLIVLEVPADESIVLMPSGPVSSAAASSAQ